MTESSVTVLESPYSKTDGNRFLGNVDERKVHLALASFFLTCSNGEVCMRVGSWFVFWFSVVLRTVCLIDGKWWHV